MDDVISTGESLHALETLVTEAGGIVASASAHRAEFADSEGLAVQSGTFLPEKKGPAFDEQNRKGRDRKQRQPDGCREQHGENVKGTLQCAQGPCLQGRLRRGGKCRG